MMNDTSSMYGTEIEFDILQTTDDQIQNSTESLGDDDRHDLNMTDKEITDYELRMPSSIPTYSEKPTTNLLSASPTMSFQSTSAQPSNGKTLTSSPSPSFRETTYTSAMPTKQNSFSPSAISTLSPSFLPSLSRPSQCQKNVDSYGFVESSDFFTVSFLYGIESDILKDGKISEQIANVEQRLLEIIARDIFSFCEFQRKLNIFGPSKETFHVMSEFTIGESIIDQIEDYEYSFESVQPRTRNGTVIFGIESLPLDITNGEKCIGENRGRPGIISDCNVIRGRMNIHVATLVAVDETNELIKTKIKRSMNDGVLDNAHEAILRVMYLDNSATTPTRISDDDVYEVSPIEPLISTGYYWMFGLVAFLLLYLIGTTVRYVYSKRFDSDGFFKEEEFSDDESSDSDISYEESIEDMSLVSYGSEGSNSKKRRLANGKINFLTDDKRMMTYGRRIAIYLSKRYAWYYPGIREERKINRLKAKKKKSKREWKKIHEYEATKPSIEKAWAYFEHNTLPRRKWTRSNRQVDNKKKQYCSWNRILDRSSPGEDRYETKLYHPLTTPLSQMGDFGISWGMYFSSLLYTAILMFLAGLMNIPNMIYFASNEYSDSQEGVSWYLKGSAVCTQYEFVPCPSCDQEQFKSSDYRFTTAFNEMGEPLNFAIKSNCDGAKFRVGMVNFGTTLLFVVGFFAMRFYLSAMEVKFDEDEQTAQDYSIVIRNPPEDAFSVGEWSHFFRENFSSVHVVLTTVVMDNDELIQALIWRRSLLKQIENIIPKEKDLSISNLRKIAEKIEKERNIFQKAASICFGGIPSKVRKLEKANDEIVELCKYEYPVSAVFVTFDTERAQRLVLREMNVPFIDALRQNKQAVKDHNYLFRGEKVLYVEEPPEPSTINWRDLQMTWWEYSIKYVTTTLALGLLAASFFAIRALHNINTTFSAFGIALTNMIFPSFARILSRFEKHSSEEKREVWLYTKIMIFRCINTVVITLTLTPFMSTTLGGANELLGSIFSIFYADIFTVNIVQLLDITDNFKRHVLAPRQKTQESMNLQMKGFEVFVAERYTAFTKLVLLSTWYCPIYPAVFFFCAFALFILYFVDKFSLMRTWRPAPKLGRSLSGITRDITFPIMIVLMAYNAVYFWSGFRFDQICEHNGSATPGDYELPHVAVLNLAASTITVFEDTQVYTFCRSNENVMTGDQERLTFIYTRFSWTLTVLVGLIVLYIGLYNLRHIYFATYSACGKAQNTTYSEVATEAGAYIPQEKSYNFSYPFITSALPNQLDFTSLFEWKDPRKPYEYYDLTRDAIDLVEETGETLDDDVFSQVDYSPSHWAVTRGIDNISKRSFTRANSKKV